MPKGIGISAGIVIGKAYVLGGGNTFPLRRHSIKNSEIEQEIQRFKKAISKSTSQLVDIKNRAKENLGEEHLFIIDTQLTILKDTLLINGTIASIKKYNITAEWAIRNFLTRFTKTFERVGDEYLKGKKTDIEYICMRVINNLIGHPFKSLARVKEPVIVVANDLSPSDAVQMDKKKVIGLITSVGGKTSHTSILAAAMGIPSVSGLKDITNHISTGDPLIVDGNDGIVIIKPANEIFKKYLKKQQRYKYYEKELLKYKDLAARTKDGYQIKLMGNIGHSNEVDAVNRLGADGVGLYRTEYLFMNRKRLPSEEELFSEYKKIALGLDNKSAVIRTIDLGGDKLTASLKISGKGSQVLGMRGIRLCLNQVKIFKTQLRGILRASHYGNISIMFPMISALEELRSAKEILDKVKTDLRKENIPFAKNIKIGIMIETPSSAIISDILAKEVDFFSIGTNDLIQYTIAVDRGNDELAYLYQPLHPSIIRLLKTVISAANTQGIPVSICGEMGSDPYSVIILMGLGELDVLSMDTHSIPKIKKWINQFTITEAKNLARESLSLETAKDVHHLLAKSMGGRMSTELTYN